MIRDAAGNLYGTAGAGGLAEDGVVFRLDPAGEQTVLHTFSGGTNGSAPEGGVIGDPQGNLYGTTNFGGAANVGVVYKIDSSGHETVLYSFGGGPAMATPTSGVIRDKQGNLYGTTLLGGSAGGGIVYKLDPAGRETVLHNFTGGNDGRRPNAALAAGAQGSLYGTTLNGGSADVGVVYKLDASGAETVLYSFTNGADGGGPYAGVILDDAGNLYGTTAGGGANGGGTVFKLDPSGHETVLYSFGSNPDGHYPNSGVIRDAAGNLFGTTWIGGAGYGVVYRVDAAGHENVLYSFTGGEDGALPQAGVIGDAAGNLYGTTYEGGTASGGVVFKLDAAGQETVLYGFPAEHGGNYPESALAGDRNGNLYGTTYNGGRANAGVVYRVDMVGHHTVLYSFTGGADGGWPVGGVMRDGAGNLYGTTYRGGASGAGALFKVDTSGRETVLHSFTGGADGGNPQSGVIEDAAGNLYGVASSGGNCSDCGVVYKMDTADHYKVLYSFPGGTGGYEPYGVTGDAGGNLYGTTHWGGAAGVGMVYRLDAAGSLTVLYSFTGGADGGWPMAGVFRDPAGNLYGTTVGGGAWNAGVVFKLDPSGEETALYTFTGGADGANPQAGVIGSPAGLLYGTVEQGGAAGMGVAYELDAAGDYTLLHSFTGGLDGSRPAAALLRDDAGNLFGTATGGGTRLGGVVFLLKP